MAALGRLADLEEFVLGIQPQDAFRPRARLAVPGRPARLHAAVDGRRPHRIAGGARSGARSRRDRARRLRDRRERLSGGRRSTRLRARVLVAYDRADVMGRAILASAAISGLVLPIQLDGRIATDGGWVRNFPFEHAYRNPDVAAIAAFRYVASYPPTDAAFLERTRERLERFRAVPPVRALLAEVRLAQERSSRGEPAHYGELIARLMRVAFARNAVVEERIASERDTSVQELRRLQEDVTAAAVGAAAPWRRQRLRAELEARFASARFPFRHDRHVPAVIVRGDGGRRRPRPDLQERQPVADRAQAGPHRARLCPHRRSASAKRSRRAEPRSGSAATRPPSGILRPRSGRLQGSARSPSPLGDGDLRQTRRSAGVRAGGRTPCR